MPPAPGSPALPPDGALPPLLLLISLHGDKDKPSDADNALRRYRLTGGRSAYGRARVKLDELIPVTFSDAAAAAPPGGVAFAPAGDDVASAPGGRRALLYPRGLALLPGGGLAVASAGGDGGSVRVASAAAVCDAGGGLAPAPPPPPPPRAPGPAASKADASSTGKPRRVPSSLLCGAGLDHPYGIAVAVPPSRLVVSNQGSGVVSVCELGATQQKGGPAPEAFFAQHGAGRATADVLPADADDGADDNAADAQPPTSDAATTPPASARRGGDASSPLRGIAVDPASGRVYIAAKDLNTVYEHAPNGTLLDAIPAAEPISLLWDPFRGGLYISSDARATVRVLFWDAASRSARATLAHRDGAGHAAGMALLGSGALLVLGQGAGALYQFDLATGAMVATLAQGLPRPEAVLVYGGPCSVS